MIRHLTKTTAYGYVYEYFRELDIESRPYGFTVTLYSQGSFSPNKVEYFSPDKVEYFSDWEAVKSL